MDDEKRLPFIDYARAIGIFLVILGHTIALSAGDRQYQSVIYRTIYSFHMPLFFVISGYLISHKQNVEGIRTLVKKYLLPYLGISFVYIIITACKNNFVIPYGDIYVTFCGRGMAPIWFLSSLFIGEVVLGRIYHIAQNRGGGTCSLPAAWRQS